MRIFPVSQGTARLREVNIYEMLSIASTLVAAIVILVIIICLTFLVCEMEKISLPISQ